MQATVTRRWAPRGSEPKVASKPGRSKVSYSGFLVAGDGRLHVNKPSWFNFETVIGSIRDFVEACPPPEGKRWAVVIDNAPWHKKAYRLVQGEAWEEYADIRESVLLVRMPPYSPDLNPIEQVWRVTRRKATHNRYFPSVESLASAVDGQFANYSEGSEELRSLCDFRCFRQGAEN